MARKKILWLVSWYPNRLMPFNGDFIKRHAEAVSLFEEVQVMYVVRDLEGHVTKDVLTEESIKDGLAEKIIYYYIPSTGLSIIDKYLSEKKYRKLFKQAVNDYIKKSGLPHLAHVHVGMKAGVIARGLKKSKAVPYVISEHWSGFLHEAEEKINDQPFYIRSLWKKVMMDASGFSTVSKYLADAVQSQFALHHIRIIPNVINTSVFYPAATIQNAPRFIHISGLEELKNPANIIRAFSIITNAYPSATLDIFGPENKQLRNLTAVMQLEQNISFHQEIPQQQLAEFVRQSLALILYSSYETFGCVIIEANACGIPVIVSDIAVLHETVEEGFNGVFAKRDDPAALAERIIEMIKNRSSFDSNSIAKKASAVYNYEIVGKQFSDWYSEILSKA